ncbi:MAG: hypothetical protein K8E66_04450 [Phycisphaerales bacterium]|nr:hypothetical protein [Phycisphaerales bacterium]
MSRSRRHAALTRMLSDHLVATQEQLVEALHAAGEPVTQATVSRDLAAIGAVRGPGGYRLPADPLAGSGTNRLAPTIHEHATSVEPAATLVVVRTATGHASVIASELDAARPTGMVGCVAGDDTVMIATPSTDAAAALTAQLTCFMEGG